MKTIKLSNTQLRSLIKEAMEGAPGNIRINIVVEIDAEDLLADAGPGVGQDDVRGALSAKLDQVISEIGLEDQLMQELTDVDGAPVAIRSVTVEGQ